MSHHHQVSGKNLFITIVLNIIITLSQIIGAFFSGSLALLSDALHNFSDVMALAIAYYANRLSSRTNSEEKTFGYKRAEILAALFNASVLIGIAIFLIIEAIQKLYHPEVVDSLWVIGLGFLSIVLNAISVLLVKDDAHDNMNIKAAYLHLLTDVMTSIGVVVGGVMMYYFGLFWIDSLISLLIAFYLIFASFSLLKESGSILMQFAPDTVAIDKIVSLIQTHQEIENVHHIHIWKLNDKQIHFEAHLDFSRDLLLSQVNAITIEIEKSLHDLFDIEHITLQSEYNCKDDKSLIAGKS